MTWQPSSHEQDSRHGKEREMRGSSNVEAIVAGLMKIGTLRGSDEEDLSSLEGLSADDLSALKDLSGLTAEEVQALADGDGDAGDSVDGLKSALRKERQARRAFEKEVKAYRKAQEDAKNKATKDKADADAKDKELTSQQASEATIKAERLAAGLQRAAVDTAIVKALAGSAKLKKLGITFKDQDDALRLIDRDEIEVDQDDDDPSKVVVDEDSVVDALKNLAKKKPHLKADASSGDQGGGGQGGGAGGRTSTMGGRTTNVNATRNAELVKKYPALGRR